MTTEVWDGDTWEAGDERGEYVLTARDERDAKVGWDNASEAATRAWLHDHGDDAAASVSMAGYESDEDAPMSLDAIGDQNDVIPAASLYGGMAGMMRVRPDGLPSVGAGSRYHGWNVRRNRRLVPEPVRWRTTARVEGFTTQPVPAEILADAALVWRLRQSKHIIARTLPTQAAGRMPRKRGAASLARTAALRAMPMVGRERDALVAPADRLATLIASVRG